MTIWEKCTVIPHLTRWNCGGKESSNFASLEFKGVQKMIQKSGKGLESLSSLPIIWVSQECQRFLVCPYMNNHKDCWRISCASKEPVADPILVVVVVQPNMAGRKVHSLGEKLSTSLWIPMGHRCFHWNFYGHRNWVDIKNYPKGEIRKSIVVFSMCLFFWQDADWALHAPEAQKLVTWPQWTHHHISFQIILITFL